MIDEIFSTQPTRRRARFFSQQLTALFALPVLLFLLVMLLLPIFGRGLSSAVINLSLVAAAFGAVLLAGYKLPRRWESGFQIARWTWVLPVALLLLLFFNEWANFGFRFSLEEFFNPGPNEEPLVMLFVTAPTISAVAYSLGAMIGARKESRDHTGEEAAGS